MKKIIITMIVIFCLIPSTAFAGTTLNSAHSSALIKLTDACGYYGWCTSEMQTVSKSKTKTTSFVGTVNYNNQVYTATFKVKTTKKSSKKYTSKYYVGSKSYSLSSVKKMLKKYSSAVGRTAAVKKSTIDIADQIILYAQSYNWDVEVTSRTEEENKYAECIQFTNDTYQWVATIITTRTTNKLVVTYTRDGANSNRAAIEDWLKKYSELDK